MTNTQSSQNGEIELDPEFKTEIAGALARAYCYVENSGKQMDSELLRAMGIELNRVIATELQRREQNDIKSYYKVAQFLRQRARDTLMKADLYAQGYYQAITDLEDYFGVGENLTTGIKK